MKITGYFRWSKNFRSGYSNPKVRITVVLLHLEQNAQGAKSNIKCDTLIMDNASTSDTIPWNEIMNDEITLEHEATVFQVSEEQLFYLMSRGLSTLIGQLKKKSQAAKMMD
ncbi:MAG: sufB [Paenibacillus sp.]|jgi:hypothetical protein|nr:sufB [Paenibacillus sp.]